MRAQPTQNRPEFCKWLWSLWKERWSSTGPFGTTVLALDDALACVAAEDIVWTGT